MTENDTQQQRRPWHAVKADEVIADFQANSDGLHHEEGRCFYVASSRARRLLWIVSEDQSIEKVFPSFV